MAMTIIASAFLALMNAVVIGQQHAYEGDMTMRAVRLGNDLLEEIVSRDYRDPDGGTTFGPESDEMARANFDDVDDYNGYSESAGQLTDSTGAKYTGLDQTFSRSVIVADADQTLSALSCTIHGRSVTVTVRNQNGAQWQFARFIPNPAQ